LLKYLKFRIHELSLATPLADVRRELEKLLGEPLVTRRMPLGNGWSLKYLAYSESRPEPAALIKVASRMIERRLKAGIGHWYAPPASRYVQEAEVLSALARLDLAPEVLLVGENYQIRRYTMGACLAAMPETEVATCLPLVLGAIDTAWRAGIFHTDINAGNVIITQSGGVHFIDSETPSKHTTGEPLGENYRAYGHERLIETLARLGNPGETVAATLKDYYAAHDGPLTTQRAGELLAGRAQIMEYPE
jgi:hypothetical protein